MTFSTFNAFKQLRGGHELTPDEIRALQTTLTTMLRDVAEICASVRADWMLGGGSALGARRHGGFIPWDDDLDINMPRADWPRVRDALRARLGDRYAIYEPGAPASYALDRKSVV